jgi:hypothetical protein
MRARGLTRSMVLMLKPALCHAFRWRETHGINPCPNHIPKTLNVRDAEIK